MGSKAIERWKSWSLVLPALVIFTLVILAPALFSLVLSFFAWDGLGGMRFVGLGNYRALFFQDQVFWTALKNNLLWVLMNLGITMGLAFGLALALNGRIRGRVVFRGIFYFPYLLSWVIAGILWKWIYNPNFGLLAAGHRWLWPDAAVPQVLANGGIALAAVFLAALWQGIGQPVLYFLAGLQTLPPDMLEAARMDGAKGPALLWLVVLPMMRESLLIVTATQVIASLKLYDIIQVMTGGGPAGATQTLATYMYSQTFVYNQYGMGSAVAMVMVALMAGIIVPYVIYTARE